MKLIYYFDNNGYSNGENDLINSDEKGFYDIPNNATDVQPPNGLYTPLKFDGEKWTGTSKEQWDIEHPIENNSEDIPTHNIGIGNDSELRQTFGSLQMSSVQTVKMVTDLSKQVTELTKQNVELQKQLNDKGVE